MKTLFAVLLLAVSTVAVAEDSYIAKYEKESHSIVVYKGSDSNLDNWVKETYLVDENNKVVGTNKTVQEFIDSLE